MLKRACSVAITGLLCVLLGLLNGAAHAQEADVARKKCVDFGFQPNTKLAVWIFGLFHGLGLGTKLQDFSLSTEGLVPNILAFNVGVELGQVLGLSAILIAMGFWRRSTGFHQHAFAANVIVMTCGFILAGYQLVGYATQ